MIFSTTGICLRSVPYGDTSLVVTVYTEKFGVQSYILNGVRGSGKNAKSHFFQPASILDMQVYHNPLNALQRIKDVKWEVVYKNVLSDVATNAISLFSIELLYKCLKQPEPQEDLFQFSYDFFIYLDKTTTAIAANMPVYFAIHLAGFLGIQLQDNFSIDLPFFNLKEGRFTSEEENNLQHFTLSLSEVLAEFLKVIHPAELSQVKINRKVRMELLEGLIHYYSWHIPDFGTMRSPAVLKQLF